MPPLPETRTIDVNVEPAVASGASTADGTCPGHYSGNAKPRHIAIKRRDYSCHSSSKTR